MRLRPPLTRLSALLASVPLLGLAGAADALQSVDLVFTELNGLPIADATALQVAPGDQVTVEMRMTTDEQGVTAYGVSVDFDSAMDGRILLDDFANVLPPGLDAHIVDPWGPDSGGTPGYVETFNAITLQDDPPTANQTFAIGTLTFTVTANIFDGPAVIVPGLFHEGVDEIVSNEYVLVGAEFEYHEVDLSAQFGFQSALLVAVPEPSTALLLGMGLVALQSWGRRTRMPASSSARMRASS